MTDHPGNSRRAGPRRLDESGDELTARFMLEEELGCRLVRVEATSGRKFPDYRTPSGDRVIEVKRITSEDFHAMGDAHEREVTEVEDRRLTGVWMVPVQRPDLSTVLPYRHDVPIFGDGTPTRLKNLAADLIEPFAVLEKHGLTRHQDPWPEPHMPASSPARCSGSRPGSAARCPICAVTRGDVAPAGSG